MMMLIIIYESQFERVTFRQVTLAEQERSFAGLQFKKVDSVSCYPPVTIEITYQLIVQFVLLTLIKLDFRGSR